MKKTILSLAVLAGLTTTAHAQSGVRIGLKGGANLASFTGTDKQGTKSKYGFSAGATFNFRLSDLISIQPELLFSQKGSKVDYAGNNNSDASVFKPGSVSGTFGQTLSYIDVPLLVRVNTGGSDGSGFFFEFGPQASFLVAQRGFIDSGDKATVLLVGDQRDTPNSVANPTLPAMAVGNSTDDFNKVVIGYAVGLGYQLTSGLSLNVRYSGDLSQVYKDGTGTADAFKPYQTFGAKFTNPNLHSSVFQLQAGYAFGGK
ncbi:porin family protein [Hymenobacter sp. M29]|uniref:Porin family protein n=1 Tax=Hymenobacter mellowenesis TaxID=3063995 RepID=A0ABT9AEK3_9BACT|nr:porin family protein [Hymenobacter sp. M29]MDO7848281.1 porin family protein [Hymenobacter sp. M29]